MNENPAIVDSGVVRSAVAKRHVIAAVAAVVVGEAVAVENAVAKAAKTVRALQLADRAVILDTGGIVFDGTAAEVLENKALREEYLAI